MVGSIFVLVQLPSHAEDPSKDDSTGTVVLALHSSVIVAKIDERGSKFKSVMSKEVSISPGIHRLTVGYIGPMRSDSRTCSIEFDFKHGVTYVVVPHISEGLWAASLRIIQPGQTRKDVTDRRMDSAVDVQCVF
jgi:hypothetical protein